MNSESNDSDNNPLALALRSLHFLPVLQTRFAYADFFLICSFGEEATLLDFVQPAPMTKLEYWNPSVSL